MGRARDHQVKWVRENIFITVFVTVGQGPPVNQFTAHPTSTVPAHLTDLQVGGSCSGTFVVFAVPGLVLLWLCRLLLDLPRF